MNGRSVRIMCRLSALIANPLGLDSGFVRFVQHSTAEARSVKSCNGDAAHSFQRNPQTSTTLRTDGELFATRLASTTQRTNSLQHNSEYLVVCSTDIGSFCDGVHEGGV